MGRGRTDVPRPAAVRSTGGSSAVSKCSAAARGYIQDRFLRLLAARQRRRAPLVHRGYYIRARAVDHCVRDFLLKTHGHARTQIVSLGAGFDSLFFRLKDMGLLHGAAVYEVDFPSVARQKAALIETTRELSALVGEAGGEELGVVALSGEDYKLLGVDLSELSELERALEGAGLDSGAPTLFIAEVVLTYMENSRSDALIQWAAGRFPRACFVLYEQVRPRDPFGRVMQQHFSQRGSALRALARYPDCGAQRRRFLEQGWTECSVMDMNEFFTRCTPQEEQQRVQALEPFDEYEMRLTCTQLYSHTAHVHDGKLLLVGGVWFHSSSVPGVTVIDLMTGLCLDYTIDVEHLEWPLMLHNHSSVFLPDEEELLLIGGGGNCFSFGTHLNAEPVVLSLRGVLASG